MMMNRFHHLIMRGAEIIIPLRIFPRNLDSLRTLTFLGTRLKETLGLRTQCNDDDENVHWI